MHAMAETGDHERLTRVLKSMPAGTFEPEDNSKAAAAGQGAGDGSLAQKRKRVRCGRLAGYGSGDYGSEILLWVC